MTLPTVSPAAVLTRYGAPLEVREVPVPPIEPRGILVRVEAATMCGTDVSIWRGHHASSNLSKLPLIPGHEMVGRVVALGRERTTDAVGRRLQEGDRIAWAYAWCGECFWCTVAHQPTLCERPRMYGWGPVTEAPYLTGGFSRYAYVMPQCAVVKAPEALDAGLVASATCALRSIVHGYERIGRIEPTDTVVIQGSGPVGLYAAAFAIQSGARQVIVVGAPDVRLEVARRWGADLVLDVTRTEAASRRQAVLDVTDGRGADLVVECSGAHAAFGEGLDLLRRGGTYLILGGFGSEPVAVPPLAFNLNQITVAGSFSGDVSHYHRALSFLETHSGRFSFEDLLSGRYTLDTVDDAMAGMAELREIKPVVVPE